MISLTATPPYDSSTLEWNRYITTCGEIDDEIFVPELVKEKTLCPHQDYVIFNYPSVEETKAFSSHRSECYIALRKIFQLDFLSRISKNIYNLYKNKIDYIYSNFKYIVAVMIFLEAASAKPNKRMFYKLTNSKAFPKLDNKYAERSLQFLLDDDKLLKSSEKDEIIAILRAHSMIERKKVLIDLNDRLKRNLISSTGKLNSISQIYVSEKNSLGNSLRMLILTDYIKKETVSKIGSDYRLNSISVVSIFEQLRRNNQNIKLAVLSGSLVIFHNSLINHLMDYCKSDKAFKTQIINDTDYSIVTFKGNNKEKVKIVSKLFEEGLIECLIGTQSLLGEGWDSPCINSLILASYVGSFMLSNQMRGRAIRIDKNDPNKVSNIWHLVTVEPEYVFEDNIALKAIKKINEDKSEILSCDYETLIRRSDCFVGPNYSSGEIESGIERLTFIKPPFNKKNFEHINDLMLEKAQNRKAISIEWNNNNSNDGKIYIESSIPKQLRTNPFTYINIIGMLCLTLFEYSIIQVMVNISKIVLSTELSYLSLIILTVVSIRLFFLMYKFARFIVKNISPKKSIESISKAIVATLKKLELIDNDALLDVKTDELNLSITVGIKNASIKSQSVFNEAIKELLSPIDNPKYIIIKSGLFNRNNYRYSYACPKIIYNTIGGVKVLNKELSKMFGKMKSIYVYYDKGRQIMMKCKRKSFISDNSKIIRKKQKISKFE